MIKQLAIRYALSLRALTSPARSTCVVHMPTRSTEQIPATSTNAPPSSNRPLTAFLRQPRGIASAASTREIQRRSTFPLSPAPLHFAPLRRSPDHHALSTQQQSFPSRPSAKAFRTYKRNHYVLRTNGTRSRPPRNLQPFDPATSTVSTPGVQIGRVLPQTIRNPPSESTTTSRPQNSSSVIAAASSGSRVFAMHRMGPGALQKAMPWLGWPSSKRTV